MIYIQLVEWLCIHVENSGLLWLPLCWMYLSVVPVKPKGIHQPCGIGVGRLHHHSTIGRHFRTGTLWESVCNSSSIWSIYLHAISFGVDYEVRKQKNVAEKSCLPLGLFYLIITHNVETEPRYSLTSNGNTLHCEYCIRNVITISEGLGRGFEPSFLNLLGLICNGILKLSFIVLVSKTLSSS